MRLLCDGMLAGIARWLRTAGYDAALAAAAMPDDAVIACARQEHRLLLTRDRQLARDASGRCEALLLSTDDADAQAAILAEAGVDWLCAPFTRCLVDNSPLIAADAAAVGRVPARAQALPGPFRTCPDCGRVYWPGSHARRMLARLDRWQAAGRDGASGTEAGAERSVSDCVRSSACAGERT